MHMFTYNSLLSLAFVLLIGCCVLNIIQRLAALHHGQVGTHSSRSQGPPSQDYAVTHLPVLFQRPLRTEWVKSISACNWHQDQLAIALRQGARIISMATLAEVFRCGCSDSVSPFRLYMRGLVCWAVLYGFAFCLFERWCLTIPEDHSSRCRGIPRYTGLIRPSHAYGARHVAIACPDVSSTCLTFCGNPLHG